MNKFEIDLGDYTITSREMIVSTIIIAVFMILGILIGGNISDAEADANQKYNQAVKISDQEQFEYGMRTNIGNAFVSGDLETIDPVSFPEIPGQYMQVEKVTEEYTKHYRTVTKTKTVNGKEVSYTEEEEYWTWDTIDIEKKESTYLKFLGIIFDKGKFIVPGQSYIDTLKENMFSDIRYVYYGTPTTFTGSIYTTLKDKTISEDTRFYQDMTIEELHEQLLSRGGVVIFWVIWIIITGAAMFGFYYIDNRWLE